MSTRPVSVAVLVSAGRHPVSGAARPCRGDSVALGLASRLSNGEMRVIHAGEPSNPALTDYLALGAKTIEVLPVSPGETILPSLIAALKDIDLIITGARTEVGAGSGLLPYALAAALKRPIVANVLDVELTSRMAEVRQFLPKGNRRHIALPLPAVLAVHPLAQVELKYAFARRAGGRIEKLMQDHVPSSPSPSPAWTVEHGSRQPVRLKAAEKKSGHARLLSAIVAETKGGFVANEGSCVDKAQVMLSFLREHRLVDF